MRGYFSVILIIFFLFGNFYGRTEQPSATDSLKLLIKQNTNKQEKSKLFFQLGKHFSQQNMMDSAIYYLSKSYHILPDTNNNDAQVILNEIGLNHFWQGNFPSALEYFKTSMTLAEKLQDSTVIAQRYSNLGVVYDYLGDYVQSIQYYTNALKLFEDLNSQRGMAYIYNNLGAVNEEMDQPDEALMYYKKALKIKQILADTLGIGSSLNNIGVVYEQKLENYDSALFYHQKALEVFTSANNQNKVAISLGNLGVLFWLKEKNDAAIENFNHALQISRKTGNDEITSSTLLKLGRTYSGIRDFEKAKENLEEALEISKRIKNRKRIAEIYEKLAELYARQNNGMSAWKYQVMFTNLKDSLLNEENKKQIAELETLYQVEKKDKQVQQLTLKNKIQQQSIQRYSYLLFFGLIIFILVGFITILLVRQSRLKARHLNSELKQKLLRSQMNPHFIFNTLFSIQTYMLENDSRSASRFLSKFAKLMRHILENSKHEFISLEDELEFLNQYLSIQQLRFNETFNFSVNFEGEEEPSAILVPPMLSQPFVENSIEHGIRKITTKGNIRVNYKVTGRSLLIKIEDNGPGFNHPSENKEVKNHKSTGVGTTRLRIKMLNQKHKIRDNFQITDLALETQDKTGTIITFAIPLIFE